MRPVTLPDLEDLLIGMPLGHVVEFGEGDGTASSLPDLYDGGNFWRTAQGYAEARWIDALEPRADDHIYVRFDLLLDDWLGETDVNPNLNSRMIIE